VFCAVLGAAAAAQETAQPAGRTFAEAVSSSTPGTAAELRFQNRPITVFRATILSRPPADRAATAAGLLESLVDRSSIGPVSTRAADGAIFVAVGGRDVFGLVPLDVDALAGETLEGKASDAAARLQQALDEAVELRTPRRMIVSVASTVGVTLLLALLLWAMVKVHRALLARVLGSLEGRLERLSGTEQLAKLSRTSDMVKLAVRALFGVVALFLLYAWLTFSLRRFPHTRPWGESLRSFLLDRLATLGGAIVAAIPDLFTALVILLIVRIIVRAFNAVFAAAEAGRLTLPYVYPETAQPTRRLVIAMLWLLGLVLAYPYLPGSGSEAFKGVSVFVGLVISLGSSGIVNQMMSGLTITYSRALRAGDFARIGDVEGTVTHLGALSTKVKTPRGEEVTIPNAVVMSNVTVNYSRFADTEGVYVPTSVTIGYDTPWRQVHALLLLAAERTEGIRKSPKPVVRQTALQDFYVQYTLLVALERPQTRISTLGTLHANIQDAFNEYGVQIMSPNYEADPEGRKVVPPEQWFAAPAPQPVAQERV
jgi:small-conductance mechanosensitive channel